MCCTCEPRLIRQTCKLNDYLIRLTLRTLTTNGGNTMAPIKDIAQMANVSVCTVSRYLNNKIVIRKETEERINNAIKELKYVPNVVARSLKENTTNVAVILPRINNMYYSEMTAGISEVLGKNQYQLFIHEVDNQHLTEEQILRTMRENLMAGVIFIGLSYDMSFQGTLHQLLDYGIPVVYMNRQLPYTDFPLVYPDFTQVGVMAARHLIEKGRRRLALVLKKRTDSAQAPHIKSFCSEVAKAGLQKPVLLESEAGGAPPSPEAVDGLLSGRFDGAFVLNELMSIGLVNTLVKRGVRVPDDLAVLGFGNSILGELANPELSCIDLQNHMLGSLSAELILQQVAREPFENVTVVPPFIIQREST